MLRKLILRRLGDLNKITSKVVDDDTDLEKVKGEEDQGLQAV